MFERVWTEFLLEILAVCSGFIFDDFALKEFRLGVCFSSSNLQGIRPKATKNRVFSAILKLAY